MKKKKLNKSILIGGIVVIILIMLFLSNKSTSNMVTARYYDSNKRLIVPTFSTVDGRPNITYIDISVKVENTNTRTLTCNILTSSPVELESAITKQDRVIGQNQDTVWTSSLINITKFSGTVNFNSTVKCDYFIGETKYSLPNQTGGVNVIIQ